MNRLSYAPVWSAGGKRGGDTAGRKLARGYRRFINDDPGRRFVDFHKRWRRSFKNPALNAVLLAAGVVLVITGFWFGFVTGVSGFAFGVPGTMLIASRSQRTAVWLDWCEVKCRCVWVMASRSLCRRQKR